MSSIRISRIEEKTRVEGPGLRYAIWVQGCPIRCKGCFNTHTWDMDGGISLGVDEIFRDIKHTLKFTPELEGVTFLGGEPFSQAYQLSILAKKIKELGLTIVTFTGYTYDTILKSNNPIWHRLMEETDLLIDGPYIQSQLDFKRPWVGSKNQQYLFLTDTYKHLQEVITTIPNKIEIRIQPNGMVTANGMAHQLDLNMLYQLGYIRKEDKK